VTDWGTFASRETGKAFLLPALLTAAVLPVTYALGVLSAYEQISSQMLRETRMAGMDELDRARYRIIELLPNGETAERAKFTTRSDRNLAVGLVLSLPLPPLENPNLGDRHPGVRWVVVEIRSAEEPLAGELVCRQSAD
jgi:hypothetical protein